MRIGFDLDGVIVDGINEIWREVLRRGHAPADHTVGEMRGSIEETYGIAEDEFKDILSCDLYRRCKPIDEVMEDVRRWRDEGHYIVYITARSERFTPGIEAETEKWLERHGLLDGTAGVEYIRTQKKWSRAQEHELDAFIDDDARAIIGMQGIVEHPFLMMAPYNVEVTYLRRMTWPEIRQQLDRLAEQKVGCPRALAMLQDLGPTTLPPSRGRPFLLQAE